MDSNIALTINRICAAIGNGRMPSEKLWSEAIGHMKTQYATIGNLKLALSRLADACEGIEDGNIDFIESYQNALDLLGAIEGDENNG